MEKRGGFNESGRKRQKKVNNEQEMRGRRHCKTPVIGSLCGALIWEVIPEQPWVRVCVTDRFLLWTETLQLFSMSTKEPLYTVTNTTALDTLKLFSVSSHTHGSHTSTQYVTDSDSQFDLCYPLLVNTLYNSQCILWLLKMSFKWNP